MTTCAYPKYALYLDQQFQHKLYHSVSEVTTVSSTALTADAGLWELCRREEVVEALLHPKVINLPHVVQQVYVQSLLKVFGHAGRKQPSSSDSESESEAAPEPMEQELAQSQEADALEGAHAPSSEKEHAQTGVLLFWTGIASICLQNHEHL